MSFRATVIKRSFAVLFLLGLIAPPAAYGQLTDAKGQVISPVAFVNQEAITVSFVAPPNIGATGGGSGGGSSDTTNQWLKVEFHYGTTATVTKDYPFVDGVEFKVWIEALDSYAPNASQPNGKGVAVALTGTVDYINVGMARDLYGSFYVNPAIVARYSSDRGSEDFDRKFNIHLEAYVNGVLMDAVDRRKEQDPLWYKALKAVPGLVYRQDECPFIVSDTDRYPMIKPAGFSATAPAAAPATAP